VSDPPGQAEQQSHRKEAAQAARTPSAQAQQPAPRMSAPPPPPPPLPATLRKDFVPYPFDAGLRRNGYQFGRDQKGRVGYHFMGMDAFLKDEWASTNSLRENVIGALEEQNMDKLRRALATLQAHCTARVRCIKCGALAHRAESCSQPTGDVDSVSDFWCDAIWSCCTEWGDAAALDQLLAAHVVCAEKYDTVWALQSCDVGQSTETLLSAALRVQRWNIAVVIANALCTPVDTDKATVAQFMAWSFFDPLGPQVMVLALQARAPDAVLTALFRLAEWACLAPQLVQGSSSDELRPTAWPLLQHAVRLDDCLLYTSDAADDYS
jgi:hypothetical protein